MPVDKRLRYADSITLNRIRFLHPDIREDVREAYLDANYLLLGKGVRLRFAYTLRSHNEQNDLYALGRTKLFDDNGKRLGRVTNAKGGQSIHNYGLAFDIVLLIDKDSDGRFETASWDVHADWDCDSTADWMEIVQFFKKRLNAVWGGDWNFQDKPHFQIDFGFTWRQLFDRLENRATFDELIDGKRYEWVRLNPTI